MASEIANKVKVHTIYKLADGTRVPSVTTVLGILAKPALLDWAWKMGQQGLDYKAVRDSAGDIGTLAHYLIMCHLKGEKPDTSEYSPQALNQAETCLLKYWDWEKGHQISPLLIEVPLVSEYYGFGGTIDFYGQVDGVFTLLDFKTGKAIYSEQFIQLAAYRELLAEANHPIDTTRILRIGKSEEEGFEERMAGDLGKHFDLFKHCLGIYNLQKELRK